MAKERKRPTTRKQSARTKKPAARRAPKGRVNKDACIAHLDLKFDPGQEQETSFTRADLVFTGVDHSSLSYEVRIFLNNKNADDETPRELETGYAGKFTVFGHGNCFGEAGHCEVPGGQAGGDIYTQHPLTRQRMIVPITPALERVLSGPSQQLETVTLVPISKAPKRVDRGLTPDLFKYDGVSLRTYR